MSEKLVVDLRRLERARKGFVQDDIHGHLSPSEIESYRRTKELLKDRVEKVIWIKEFARLTGEDEASSITLARNKNDITITVPSLSAHFGPIDISIPIEALDVDFQGLLPPLNHE